MNFETVILNEKSKHNRLHIIRIHLYEVSGIEKIIETESMVVVSKNYGKRVM